MTTRELLDDLLRREGGFVNHTADRGGPTNFGITAATLGSWRNLGRSATAAEVQALGQAEALAIYTDRYLTRPGFNHVTDDALRALLVDYGVHSGPARATQALQRALGVTVDGIFGPRTRAALLIANSREVYRAVLRDRGELLAGILQRNSTQRVFAAGWMRRLMEFV